MRGYVFLGSNGILEVKTAEYIDNSDPGFFERNRRFILLVWKFDSENEGMMYDLLESFQRRQIHMTLIKEFCEKIKFDLPTFLTKYATPKTGFAPL